MVSIWPDFFFVKSRLRLEKLLLLLNRLLDTSEWLVMLVGGRLGVGVSTGLVGFGDNSTVGDITPEWADIDPFGVLKFRLGNRPNCAVCRDDLDETDRGDIITGDTTDAPDIEEYAESLPVNGGLSTFLVAANRFGPVVVSSVLWVDWEDKFLRCPKSLLVRPDSACVAARPRSSSVCQVSW